MLTLPTLITKPLHWPTITWWHWFNDVTQGEKEYRLPTFYWIWPCFVKTMCTHHQLICKGSLSGVTAIPMFVRISVYGYFIPWLNGKRWRPATRFGVPMSISKTFFFFVFFEKIPVTVASLEKLPCHADFPHITTIALSKSTWGE